MPINYKNYPKNWKNIREEILKRAGNKCEWVVGECNGCNYRHDILCAEYNGQQAIKFRGKVVLTIAHLCHKPKCARRKHLMALCQLHHNRYDAKHRALNRKKNSLRKIKSGMGV